MTVIQGTQYDDNQFSACLILTDSNRGSLALANHSLTTTWTLPHIIPTSLAKRQGNMTLQELNPGSGSYVTLRLLPPAWKISAITRRPSFCPDSFFFENVTPAKFELFPQ